MTYQEFLQEIFAKTATGRKLELQRISKFLDAINNPEKKLHGIHIAGTNGKGSVAATIESILDAHKIKIGLNTSPHLVNYEERFRINKKEVEPARLQNIYEQHRDLHERFDTTYFEITTSIAFQLFYEETVEYAIMEVGLGGRLDATVFLNSVITAITNIDLDHRGSLGSTLSAIAKEKAGIVKPSIPVVLGPLSPSADGVIKKIAKEKESPVIEFKKEVKLSCIRLYEDYSVYNLSIPRYNIEYKELLCSLAGIHQIYNSALGILITAVLFEKDKKRLNEDGIRKGLAKIVWQGRMQKICDQPRIIVDGAHNPGGIGTLVYNLTHIFSYRKLIIVTGILGDKDFRTMLRKLAPITDLFITCKPNSERALDSLTLSREIKKYKIPCITKTDVIDALETARTHAGPPDLICVTGSLYTVGEVLARFQK
jgi:dihydrofolate synthase/folylpolyglutamate synthase